MTVGPEREELVLQKWEKKTKNRRNEKAEAVLVEAVCFSSESETGTREVGGNRVGLMMYDKEHKRKETKEKKKRDENKEKKEKRKKKAKKEKKVESLKESELDIIVEDIVNVKDHTGAKKKKRKLEPNGINNDQEKYKVKTEKGDKLMKNKGVERKKEKIDTGKDAVSSTFVEAHKDKEEGSFKETHGLRESEKEDVSNLKEYEGHQEKDKKQKNVKNKKMKRLEYSEKKNKTNRMNKETTELESCEVEDIQEWEQGDDERKKQEKKHNRVKERGDIEIPKMKHSNKVSGEKKISVVRSREFENEEDFINGSSEEKMEYTKKGMNRGKQEKNHINGCSRESLIENLTSDGKAISDHKEVVYNEGRPSSSNKKRGREKEGIDNEMEKREKKNRKKSKLVNDVEEKGVDYVNLRTKDSTSDHSKDSEPKKSPNRVKFSDQVEFFPSSDATDVGLEHDEHKLVQGKRFSKKEDQMIKYAVYNFIEVHGLGENGVHMVLNCRTFPETRNCWKEIASSLPWRPLRTIYWRAHNLFTRGELNSWTAEDKALIVKFYNEKGPDWTTLAQAVGKHRIHLKDIWRTLRYPNLKKGHWSQEEYQTLFELVNLDLQMKVHEEKKTKHGMLRDNISWAAISEKMGTRLPNTCCAKWYHKLSSSMVKAGEWDESDDYRLLNELLKLDACCVEDVDWDNLIDHRSGEACLKRWKQMCLHIGNHGIKPFAEQVEVLGRRYCPNLLEVREALDSRPVVK